MDTLKKENRTDFEKDLLAMEEKYGIKFNKIIFTGWIIQYTCTYDNFKQTIIVNQDKLAQWELEVVSDNGINTKQYRI